MKNLLSSLGDYFTSKSINSYLVGGCVRDRLLSKESREIVDYDLMIEADVNTVFKELYKLQDLVLEIKKPIIYKKYKTAKITFLNEGKGEPSVEIDFASARKEFYPEIASKPVCSFGVDIEEDLKRRDFSINAMAMPLNDANKIIDHFNSRNDLENALIRVLHQESFRDDPVRIIRAYKFLSRFNFELERETKNLILKAVQEKYSTYLNPKRVKDELLKVLNEQKWHEVFSNLEQIGVLGQFSLEIQELLNSGNKDLGAYRSVLVAE